MPGRLRRSFRFGNLAEHLGLLLLKGIAAIAECSRAEDVGLDAIATLLRCDEDGNSYAEGTFVVQLKSDSTKILEYRGHEVEWLVGQSQPMFIGLVSLERSEIALYPTLHVNQAVLSLHAENVTVHFGRSELPAFLRGQEWMPWHGDSNGGAVVWLGDPLLQWTLRDLREAEWTDTAYRALKRFLGVAYREIELLSYGQSSVLKWSTNDAKTITADYGMMKGPNDDLENLANRCLPSLRGLMHGACRIGDGNADSMMRGICAVAASLRELGVEIDEHDLFGKMLMAYQFRTEQERNQ